MPRGSTYVTSDSVGNPKETAMPSKATFLAGFATGYVLGSRAGRERYEQIRRATQAFAHNPTVQSTAATLQQQAGDALSLAKDKATGAVSGRLSDKRPAWLASSVADPSEPTWVAGSNGHVGP
jgi:hypothetical protein